MAVRKKKAVAAEPGAGGKPGAKGKAGKAKAKPRERNDRRGLRSHKEGEKPKPRAKPKAKAKAAVKKAAAEDARLRRCGEGTGPTKKKAAVKKAAPGKRRAAGAMGVLGVVCGEALARVDGALMAEAEPLVMALAKGQALDAKERRVVDRFVAAFEDSVFWVLASRSPQKWVLGLLESSSKVMLDWEAAGMPRNGDKGRTYNLWQVLPWVKGRLRGGDVAWETAPEDIRRQYLEQQVRDKTYQADMRKLELKRRRNELIERVYVHEAFGQIAAALRRSGERLAHRFGDDARKMFSEGLERARERVREYFGDGGEQGMLGERVAEEEGEAGGE